MSERCRRRVGTEHSAVVGLDLDENEAEQSTTLPPAALRASMALWYNYSYTIGMKTAISIPDKTFQLADQLAKTLGLSRSELYATAVAEYLDRRVAQRVTARLDAVYGAVDGRVEPGLAGSQARSTAREDRW